MKTRVLVVGPRPGLLNVLDDMSVPYGVWTNRPPAGRKSTRGADFVHVAPFGSGEDVARRESDVIADRGAFTHVIAGTQAAVMPAAVARRRLGARLSVKTTVLRCHDKLYMKRHLHERGVPMTAFMDAGSGLDAADIGKQLGFPVVIKPRTESGGRGIEFIGDEASLARARRRGRIFESFVDAPEVSVESLVNGGSILFVSTTEYAVKGHVNLVPAGIDEETRAEMLALNRTVIEALRIQWGMTHAEMYRTADGLLFGEIALRPPGGYIMNLVQETWGFDAWRAFVSVELDQPVTFPDNTRAHAAAIVLHPGEGTVAAIHGYDSVLAHPAVVDARLRVGVGDVVGPRPGVGVDVGYIVLRAATRAALDDAMKSVNDEFRIELADPS